MDKAWNGTSALKKGGTAAYSATRDARATFTFTGTSVTWIGLRGPTAGIAEIWVDGVSFGRVDLYAATEQLRASVFTATGLPNGTHTLRIDVTGDKNASASSALIVVDAFDTTPSLPAPQTARFQETHASASYAGGWVQQGPLNFWSGRTIMASGIAGARATFTFAGRAVRWIGYRRADYGLARVSIDGAQVAQVDTLSAIEEFQAVVFSATMPAGNHTLTIDVIGRNGEAPGASVAGIVVDAFEVIP